MGSQADLSTLSEYGAARRDTAHLIGNPLAHNLVFRSATGHRSAAGNGDMRTEEKHLTVASAGLLCVVEDG